MSEESSKENSPSSGRSPVGDRSAFEEQGVTSDHTQDKPFTAEEATDIAGVGAFQVKLIVLSGFIWMARGFDHITLNSITSLLACEWQLKMWHEGVLKMISLLFAVLGCFLYGIYSDHYGRRMALSSSLIFLFVFAAISAGLRSFAWFVTFRAVSGFAIGGLPQALVLCCEYVTGRQRGRVIYILSCFWALGCLIMMYALFTTRKFDHGWRIFTAISVLPAFVAMVIMRFFPESFRFLMVRRRYFAANEIAAEMVESNGKSIRGELVTLEDDNRKSLIKGLLTQPYVKTTIRLWIMGLLTTLTYMGLNFITRTLIPRQRDRSVTANMTASYQESMYMSTNCIKDNPSEEFFVEVWTTALDFPGFIIYMILVDVIDRKKFLFASYLISSLFTFFLYFPAPNYVLHITFIYVARILFIGQFDLLLLITAETFPTSHRGTAVGLEVSSFYLGRAGSYYLLRSMILMTNRQVAIAVYGVLAFLCAAGALFVRETRGKELTDILKD